MNGILSKLIAYRTGETCQTTSQRPTIVFLGIVAMFLIQQYISYWQLMRSSVQSDYYSHIAFIPMISAYLLWHDRKVIFSRSDSSLKYGFPIGSIGVALYLLGYLQRERLGLYDFLALVNLGSIIIVIGVFISCYGIKAFRAASFPLCFLLFAVPLPSSMLTNAIHLLRVGSATLVEGIFTVTGISFIRDGYFFTLPTVSIEIAEECSGIRSSLALIITGVLASRLFLRRNFTKMILVASLIPFAVLKNAIRITTLTILGEYVDVRYLTESALHHEGGFVFFLITLALFGGILWMLRNAEKVNLSSRNAK